MKLQTLVLLVFASVFSPFVGADCRVDKSFGQATHFLVNGLINKPVPEVSVEVPYNEIGSGNAIASTVQHRGGNQTLADHARFRLRVKNKSSDKVDFLVDSSSTLNCTNCSSAISVPFSDFFWVEGKATETKGNAPGVNRFSDSEQYWFTGDNITQGNKGSDSVFNLRFYFDNTEVLPAGTYEGTVKTIGRPQ
jgi:hypothetical protein